MYMRKERIVVTGSTGGIGNEFATQMLKEGHELYLPVRNLHKAEELFSAYTNAHPAVVDIENHDSMVHYFRTLSVEGVIPDKVVMLVGDLREDNDPLFAGDTKEEKEKNSILYHERVNVLTAETVVFGLIEVYAEHLKEQTLLLGVSSWAAHFEPGHPYRANEEGYVLAKAKLSALLARWKREGFFKEVICEEPALIVTPLTKRQFPLLIADPSVQKLQPEEYVAHLRQILHL